MSQQKLKKVLPILETVAIRVIKRVLLVIYRYALGDYILISVPRNYKKGKPINYPAEVLIITVKI